MQANEDASKRPQLWKHFQYEILLRGWKKPQKSFTSKLVKNHVYEFLFMIAPFPVESLTKLSDMNTVKSRFLEPSVSQTSRYLEPNLICINLLHSSSLISPQISRTRDVSKLSIIRGNFGSRGTNSSSKTRTCENFETTFRADVNYIHAYVLF